MHNFSSCPLFPQFLKKCFQWKFQQCAVLLWHFKSQSLTHRKYYLSTEIKQYFTIQFEQYCSRERQLYSQLYRREMFRLHHQAPKTFTALECTFRKKKDEKIIQNNQHVRKITSKLSLQKSLGRNKKCLSYEKQHLIFSPYIHTSLYLYICITESST